MIKKRILICGVIAIVAGGFAVKSIVSFTQSEHSTDNYEYYYNKDLVSQEDSSMSPDSLLEGTEASLPSRDSVNVTKDSIYCLVNKEYNLPSDYIPEDLAVPDITFNITYNAEKKQLRSVAADAIEVLFKAAAQEQYELCGVSGYRSYARQKEIYTNNLATKGAEHTNKYSAKPGSSEHQTGLSMDVSSSSIGYSLSESFGDLPEGKWLAANSYKYGFIIRYPKDKEDITGYSYEPWHIRYVGIPLATYLFKNDMTLEEYYNIETRYDDSSNSDETIMDVDESDLSSENPSVVITPSTQPKTTYPAKQESSPSASVKPSVSSQPSQSSSTAEVTASASAKPSSSEAASSSTPAVSKKPAHSASPSASASVKPSATASVKPSVSPSPSAAESTEPEEDTGSNSDDNYNGSSDEQ